MYPQGVPRLVNKLGWQRLLALRLGKKLRSKIFDIINRVVFKYDDRTTLLASPAKFSRRKFFDNKIMPHLIAATRPMLRAVRPKFEKLKKLGIKSIDTFKWDCRRPILRRRAQLLRL